MKKDRPAAVRVEPVPGLRLDPAECTPDEAAAMVATGSYRYADGSAPDTAPAADEREAD